MGRGGKSVTETQQGPSDRLGWPTRAVLVWLRSRSAHYVVRAYRLAYYWSHQDEQVPKCLLPLVALFYRCGGMTAGAAMMNDTHETKCYVRRLRRAHRYIRLHLSDSPAE